MTLNTAFGRRFTETVFVSKTDATGKPVGYDRVPAIWDHHDQPVADRAYYPGDPMSAASRVLTQKTVKAKAERDAREAANKARTRR